MIPSRKSGDLSLRLHARPSRHDQELLISSWLPMRLGASSPGLSNGIANGSHDEKTCNCKKKTVKQSLICKQTSPIIGMRTGAIPNKIPNLLNQIVLLLKPDHTRIGSEAKHYNPSLWCRVAKGPNNCCLCSNRQAQFNLFTRRELRSRFWLAGRDSWVFLSYSPFGGISSL